MLTDCPKPGVSRFRPELVVFDLIGTTVEDDGRVPAALVAAFAEHGIAVSSGDLRAVRGASKREAIARVVREHTPDAQDHLPDEIYGGFRRRLREELPVCVRPISGAEATIAWLGNRNVRVALNTGFDRMLTDLVLGALGWNDVAEAVVCRDDVPEGRPEPYLILRSIELTGVRSADRVASVGDTTLDLEAGRNAAVRWNIGVLSGAHSRSDLERCPHTHLVASVAELPHLWANDP